MRVMLDRLLVAVIGLVLSGAGVGGCTTRLAMPELGSFYTDAAMRHGPGRNPVIVIPGVLGSRLIDPASDTVVWGAFGPGSASPNTAEGARLIALPMRIGVPLNELTDPVVADGALDRVRFSIFGLPIELEAYADILATLGVGGYMDQTLGEASAVDYGSDHYTCFQFDYDWRRDNAENAAKLLAFIEEKRAFVQQHLAEDFGGSPENYDVKFDLVAHSMGGLLTRYMLRYGDVPPDVALEQGVTWKGAEHVDRVILVAPPNAGSVNALIRLIEGIKPSPLHARYDAALLGTMPGIYQLLPRDRHERVLPPWGLDRRYRQDPDGNLFSIKPMAAANEGPFRLSLPPPGYEPVRLGPFSVLDASYWQLLEWGLLDPAHERSLQRMLPDIEGAAERRAVALDHVRKCLELAEQFQRCLDVPAALPEGVTLTLFAGDAVETEDRVVLGDGGIKRVFTAMGDGAVTRAAALMDEQMNVPANADRWQPRLLTPIDWSGVTFLSSDHLGLTSDPTFSDNLLHLLLQTPYELPAAAP